MLYDRWREIVRRFERQIAVRELAAARSWTFGQLAAEAEKVTFDKSAIAFPQGHSVAFILQVLRGWRSGGIVCPLEPCQREPAIHSPLPAAVAHLKTTSATTGEPQLVAFTAGQLMADVDNIVPTMGLRPEWPNLGVISLAHSYGFSNLVLPLLLHGVPLILVPATLPEELRRASQAGEDFTLPAVPALWRAWHDAGVIPANIRLSISAGSPLSLRLEEEVFSRSGLKLHNFYGSSECGGIAYDTSLQPRSDAACIGSPLQNVELTSGENGCLEVRSRAVAETYWPEPSPNLSQGVFRAGDLVEIREGLLYFRGRAGDRINVAGRKVSPETIERALSTHPQVRECLAFGVPDAESGRGEFIVACVSLKEPLTADSLKQHAINLLPAWQVPRKWWFVETLEANQRGKLSRNEARKRYLEQFPA